VHLCGIRLLPTFNDFFSNGWLEEEVVGFLQRNLHSRFRTVRMTGIN
jgi:hypothetical protein